MHSASPGPFENETSFRIGSAPAAVSNCFDDRLNLQHSISPD